MIRAADLLALEPWIRAGVFVAVLLPLLAAERRRPRRAARVARAWRWAQNLGVVVVGTLLLRAVLPLAAVGSALLAEEAGWGMLRALAVPGPLAFGLSLLLLDLAVWAQHRAFHAVPLLWRLHRMHHADLDFDASTGLRFHPLELLLSMLLKIAVVLALGAPPLAVLAFEVLLNATSMFSHSNLRLPPRLDALLRGVLVTPDMHRVHHSDDPTETDRNFGFALPWWDRLAGTYLAQPRLGHELMGIGLRGFRDPRHGRLDRMLLQPFLPDPRR
jgi:sterol desaturase/sphingolipid hydroxylase (fatty acid hydroxylase superfamily)